MPRWAESASRAGQPGADNSFMETTLRPLREGFLAEVNAALPAALRMPTICPPAVADRLAAALLGHGVVIVRGLRLDAIGLEALARHLGSPQPHPAGSFFPAHPDSAYVHVVESRTDGSARPRATPAIPAPVSRRWTPAPSHRCASRFIRTRRWYFPAALGLRNSSALQETVDEPGRPARLTPPAVPRTADEVVGRRVRAAPPTRPPSLRAGQ